MNVKKKCIHLQFCQRNNSSTWAMVQWKIPASSYIFMYHQNIWCSVWKVCMKNACYSQRNFCRLMKIYIGQRNFIEGNHPLITENIYHHEKKKFHLILDNKKFHSYNIQRYNTTKQNISLNASQLDLFKSFSWLHNYCIRFFDLHTQFLDWLRSTARRRFCGSEYLLILKEKKIPIGFSYIWIHFREYIPDVLASRIL